MRPLWFLACLVVLSPPARGQSQQAPAGQAHSRSGTATLISTKGLKPELFKSGERTGWKIRIPGSNALATPAVVDDAVYVGGGFGSHEFYAFDADSGKPRWAVRLSDDGPTAAVVAEGRVVFNTESCTLFVLDAATGKELWSRWLGDPLMSQPAVHAGIVYMAFPASDGQHHLIALGLNDGKRMFEVPIAGDIMTAPVVDGDSVYLTTMDGTVYRHRTSDGSLVWKRAMQATSAPWVSAGEIHVAQRTSKDGAETREGFRALEKGTGMAKGAVRAEKVADYLNPPVQDRSKYIAKKGKADSQVGFGGGAPINAKSAAAKINTGQGTVAGLWEYQGSRPTVAGERSYAAQGDVLRAISDKTGEVLWEHTLDGDLRKVGGHLGAPPAFAAGKLVMATTSGQVIAYDAQDGKELFRLDVKEELRFQPALAKGRVFVGTSAGSLVSVATGDASLDGWTMWGGGPEHNGPRAL